MIFIFRMKFSILRLVEFEILEDDKKPIDMPNPIPINFG